jgi:hypothetical protein
VGLPIKYPAFGTAAVFFVLAQIRVFRHEPWRDEVGTWLHVQDASSFSDLLAALDYGGHGVLWPLLQIPLAAVSTDPLILQVFHVCIATVTVWLVMTYGPFPVLAKILLCFGYYLGFEYAIIARQYSLIVLFFFILLAARQQRPDNFVFPAICMAVMADLSVHGWILAFAALVALVVENTPYRSRVSRIQVYLGLAIAIAGLLLALYDMVPPADSGFSSDWRFYFDIDRFKKVGSSLFTGFFPLPANNWARSERFLVPPGFSTVIGSLVLFLAVLSLKKTKAALYLFVIAATGLLLFFYLKHIGSSRHHGFLYIAYVGALWIRNQSRLHGAPDPRMSASFAGKILMFAVLWIQLFSSLSMSWLDWKYPFSGGRDTALFIQSNFSHDTPLVGHSPHNVGSISAYLGRKMYLPQMGMESRRVIWKASYQKKISSEQLQLAARRIAREQGVKTLLVSSRKIDKLVSGIQYLRKIPQYSIVRNESYHLYQVSPID